MSKKQSHWKNFLRNINTQAVLVSILTLVTLSSIFYLLDNYRENTARADDSTNQVTITSANVAIVQGSPSQNSIRIDFTTQNIASDHKIHFYYADKDDSTPLQDLDNLPDNQKYLGQSPYFMPYTSSFESVKLCGVVVDTLENRLSDSGNCVDTTITSSISEAIVKRSGRLYFIGSDNASLSWDSDLRLNTNFSQAQKFKDGPIKIVFDEVKNALDETLDSGNCRFDLYKYSDSGASSNVLKTYQAQLNNGQCEVDFPVSDQTVNYYRVYVAAFPSDTNDEGDVVRSGGPIIAYDIDTLILSVGGTSSTGGPTIEL
ncbi:MAG: hypothetical protein AAGF07_00330 [Patescibacteria group bacterium]